MTDDATSPRPEGEKDPESCEELATAIQNTGENDKGRQRFLIKRAVDMGCVEHIPDDWEVETDG